MGNGESLAGRFETYVLNDLHVLRSKYDPKLFLGMVRQYGAVNTAKRLLADPRHTSYGFEKLWEMKELERSVEFAVCLSWFRPLFTDDEVAEAENRLVLHDFPLTERIGAREGEPPSWVDD